MWKIIFLAIRRKHSSGAVVAELINKTFGKSSVPKRLKFNDKTKRYDSFDPEPATYVTAVYDEASRTMVLFGPSEQVELASTLLMQFETGEGKAGDVKIFHPAKMTAEELASMIREGVEGVAQKGDTSEPAKLKARIIVDNKLNRIIGSWLFWGLCRGLCHHYGGVHSLSLVVSTWFGSSFVSLFSHPS